MSPFEVTMGLLVMVLVEMVIGVVVFNVYIARTPQVVAPQAPNSRIGMAMNAFRILIEILRLKNEDSASTDAVVALRLSRLRGGIVLLGFVVVAVPALFLYNLSHSRTSSNSGFLSLAHSVAHSSDSSVQDRLWIVVWSGYVTCVGGIFLCLRENKSIYIMIHASLSRAPAQNYVILAKGCNRSVLEDAFPEAYRIEMVRTYSKTEKRKSQQEKARLPWFWSEGASPLAPYVSILSNIAQYILLRRDRYALGLQGSVNEYLGWLRILAHREATEANRDAAEAARLRIEEAIIGQEYISECEYGFVSFDTLKKKRKAIEEPRCCVVDTAPEPRDIIWERLEDDEEEDERGICTTKSYRIKLLLLKTMLVVLAVALLWALQLIGFLTIESTKNSFGLMMAAVLPAMLSGMVIGFCVGALQFIERIYPREYTQSKSEAVLSQESSLLAIFAFFLIPTIAASLASAQWFSDAKMLPMGSTKSSIAYKKTVNSNKLLELAVLQQLPQIAQMGLSALLLLKAIDLIVFRALRLPAYLAWRFALKKASHASSFFGTLPLRRQRALRLPSERISFVADSAWESFALTIGLSMAAIAPFASFFAIFYLTTSRYVRTYECTMIALPNFEANGRALWPHGIFDILCALLTSNLIHFLVLLFSGSLIHVLALLPLLFLYCFSFYFYTYFIQSEKKILSNKEENDLDARRPPHLLHRAHDFLASELAWQNRNAPPPSSVDTLEELTAFFPGQPLTRNEDLLSLHDRLESLSAWIHRYDSTTFVPTFFTPSLQFEYLPKDDDDLNLSPPEPQSSETNKLQSTAAKHKTEEDTLHTTEYQQIQQDLVYNAPILLKIQDAVWRKMNVAAVSSSTYRQ